MKQRIATLCCLLIIQSSIVTAGEIGNTAPQSSATATYQVSTAGPLRRASLSKRVWTALPEARSSRQQDQTAAVAPDTRSWVERHPVWTGAMVGFTAGFVITYAAGGSDKDEFIDFSGMRGSAALLFGGVSAGIGALAGWGIGRSRHAP